LGSSKRFFSRKFYKIQVELAEIQKKSLKNQDKILEEQIKLSKEQIKFSKILMWATIILALVGFSQALYYFEFFSQNMTKDFYDLLALTLLGAVLLGIVIIFEKLLFNSLLKERNIIKNGRNK